METLEYQSTDIWPDTVSCNIGLFHQQGTDLYGYGISIQNQQEEIIYEYSDALHAIGFSGAIFQAIEVGLTKSHENKVKNITIQIRSVDDIKMWTGHDPISDVKLRELRGRSERFITEFRTLLFEPTSQENNLRSVELARIAIEEGRS